MNKPCPKRISIYTENVVWRAVDHADIAYVTVMRNVSMRESWSLYAVNRNHSK